MALKKNKSLLRDLYSSERMFQTSDLKDHTDSMTSKQFLALFFPGVLQKIAFSIPNEQPSLEVKLWDKHILKSPEE